MSSLILFQEIVLSKEKLKLEVIWGGLCMVTFWGGWCGLVLVLFFFKQSSSPNG